MSPGEEVARGAGHAGPVEERAAVRGVERREAVHLGEVHWNTHTDKHIINT